MGWYYLNKNQQRFWVTTPYLVMTAFGLLMILMLRERCIVLRVITNSLSATYTFATFHGYQKIRVRLLDMGLISTSSNPMQKS